MNENFNTLADRVLYDEFDFRDEEDDDKPRKKRNSACTRKKWTAQEEEELQTLFMDNLRTHITPGRKECEDARKKSKENNGSIHKRSWETIKKKVWHEIKKN